MGTDDGYKKLITATPRFASEILMRLRPKEHVGVGTRSRREMLAFSVAVDTCKLIDLGYTWTYWTFEK